VLVAGVVSLLAIATSPVRVVHDGCPSGADVELALTSLIASPDAQPPHRDVAKIERRPDQLYVELADAEGIVIAERTLDGNASCAELGRMAAILIASWESDVHPEFVRQPPEIIELPHSPPAVDAALDSADSFDSRSSYDVSAGVAFGQSDTLSAGATIGAAWFPRGVGLGVWVLGAGDLARTIAVGTHEARWRRWTASVELARRWARRDFMLDAHAGLTVGLLSTEGIDYVENRSDSTVSLGATAGVRVAGWTSRRAAFWLDLRGFYFPRPDSIYGTAGGATLDQVAVPSWGAIAGVGVAVGQAPLFR
jgi:hypothetical protein